MKDGSKKYFEKQVEIVANKYYLPQYQYVQVRQSKHFMEKYLSEKIELEKIAAAAFLSRFHNIRIFSFALPENAQ